MHVEQGEADETGHRAVRRSTHGKGEPGADQQVELRERNRRQALERPGRALSWSIAIDVIRNVMISGRSGEDHEGVLEVVALSFDQAARREYLWP